MYRLTIALLAGAACAPPAVAQDRPADTRFAIGDVVVTGRSMAQSTDTVITSVDVIGGDIAQRQNVDNSWELFARLPGVVLTDFGQGTTSGRFSIRGFNGEGEINAIKLLIDGVPSNDNAGRMDFIDLVTPLDIAGIELVRGTSDARWGLHSIAGNADITTRSGGDYLDVRLLAGAFGTRDAQLAAGVETGRLAQNYAIGFRRSDGFRDHADLSRLSVAGKWAYDAGAAKLGVTIRHSHADADEPGYLTDGDVDGDRRRSYAVSADDGGTRQLSQYALHVDATPAQALAVTARAYANRIDDDRYVRFSATVAQQRRMTREQQYGLVAAVHWHVADWLMAEAGGDVQWQHNDSLRWTSAQRRLTRATRDQRFDLTVGGGYVQAVVTPAAWLTLTPAWRIDRVGGDFTDRLTGVTARVNDYGTINQPKLAVALTPIAGVTAYGNFGRTFQIGAGSGAYVVPPRERDLAPSINDGWEAGVKLTPRRWLNARVALWQQVASGELKRRLNDPAGEFDNLGRTRRRGVDVQVSVTPLPGLSSWASWSHQRAVIVVPDPATPTQAGNTIDHVPARVWSAGIEWSPPRGPWRVSLWGNGQSSYELTPANTQGRYGGYVQLTAEVARAVTRHVEVSMQVRNLTDERYDYVWFDGTQRLYAPADPRAVFGAVRMRL